MRESDIIFNRNNSLYYRCHKINFKCGGSYIDSPNRIKKTNNKPKRWWWYMLLICDSNCVKLWKNWIKSQKSFNIKPFINNYNWEGINYPSKIEDWKSFEKNNLTIAPIVLCIKEEEICSVYISKINSNCKKQIIILMITNEEKEGWHYLPYKNYRQ